MEIYGKTADMAGLGKYCMGGYGRIWVYIILSVAIHAPITSVYPLKKTTTFDSATLPLHC